MRNGRKALMAIVVGVGVSSMATLAHAGIPIGACCLPDGSCADMPPSSCTGLGGTTLGEGTSCAVDGAACVPAVGEWGVIALACAMLGSGAMIGRRNRRKITP